MDFLKLINAEAEKFAKSGKMETIIATEIESMAKGVIGDVFRSYGSFAKGLEKHIQDNLNVNFKELGIDGYNKLVLEVLKQQIEGNLMEVGKARIEEQMTELLSNVPGEVKVSELIEDFVKQNKEDEEYPDYAHENMTILVEEEDDFLYVSLDEEEGKSKYSCDVRYSIYKDKIFSLTFGGKDVEKTVFLGNLHGFEKKLFHLWAGKATVINDGQY